MQTPKMRFRTRSSTPIVISAPTIRVFAAMWLRYVEDMSVRDIASVLERSSSWTKVNLLRGRRALEAEMNDSAGNAGSEAYG
jgi:hypothetical protein